MKEVVTICPTQLRHIELSKCSSKVLVCFDKECSTVIVKIFVHNQVTKKEEKKHNPQSSLDWPKKEKYTNKCTIIEPPTLPFPLTTMKTKGRPLTTTWKSMLKEKKNQYWTLVWLPLMYKGILIHIGHLLGFIKCRKLNSVLYEDCKISNIN